MFGLFKPKQESAEREDLRADYDRLMETLQAADPAIRAEVGNSINIVNSAFVRRFGTIKSFQALPHGEKRAYILSLRKAEELALAERPRAAIGVALFKMWVGAITENDHELARYFSSGIAALSKEGGLPV